MALLEERGAVRTGHFLLSSGNHSDTYVEKARVFESPRDTLRLAEDMASWYRDVEAVVSPAVGALPLGFAVALAAKARFLYTERVSGRMTLRRGFRLDREARTLVVEDVITTGGSSAEVYELVRSTGAVALGVAALVDRSVSELPFPLRASVRLTAAVYRPEACPLCEGGRPVESPGSRHVA
jgi:orotate phosphoribosyltransferase